MPFYLKKSLSFGALRFNISKSGIGVSAGVKGFRVGTGPRGNYIHAGRGGLYYRGTLSRGNGTQARARNSPSPQMQPPAPSLTEIESGDALGMVNENSSALLTELNEKRKIIRLWPWILTLALGLVSLGIIKSSLTALIIGGLMGLLAIPCAIWDKHRKTTVLFYELESPALEAIENLHKSFDELRACKRTWLVQAAGRSVDRKYSAGATTTVQREVVSLGTSAPPDFRTNVPVLCIPAGRQKLYLLPDRLLVYDHNGVGAVAYEEIQCKIEQARFVERDAVPADANVVDQTWAFVNKSGGPDKRFSNNREIPVVVYEELSMRSTSGLNELFQFSRVGAVTSFVNALQEIPKALKPVQTDLVLNEAQMATISVDRRFFYFREQVEGPFTHEELAVLLKEGNIASDTLISANGDSRWLTFGEYPFDKSPARES